MASSGSGVSVLFVDQAGELGGAELSLLDIIRTRPGKSEAVLFSDGPFRTRLEKIGVPTTLMPLGSVGQIGRGSGLMVALKASPALAGLVFGLARRARGADLLYANTQKAFVVAAMAAPFARRPLIWHLRDMLTADHFAGAMRKVAIGLANRNAACIIANSQATADAFRAAGGTAPLRVVHNGIDPAAFDAVPGEAARAAFRAEIGVPEAPLVGVFSRLAHWKGQHVLVEAMKSLPAIHAVFVGGALFEEAAYERDLRAQIAAAGLGERCHFLGFRSDVPALMKSVDIVAHTSIAPEPFGRVVVEGMLAHRPVVATRAGGVSEIVDDGDTGLLVTPGSVEELAAALATLVGSPEAAAALAARGAEAARRRFSLQACVSGVEAIVHEVVASRRLAA
ncbi:glycosyltransferase family 4 protein [Ancylobacter lacus]|uniref:glycosyltransferase family 4 protein n=1 Tax=Ancylobacter lacus TaxID=2579970 RepID=UPI001BD06832|nr:glycosyltransferase family 4 protein [Ancylobacter lacus]MBS7538478.1 glycosyltransferase family 4 protein [Ancylobacter lacus]